MQNMCFKVLINSQYINNWHANKQLDKIDPYTKVLPFVLLSRYLINCSKAFFNELQ